MSGVLLDLCPAPPSWHVDWPALTAAFDWLAALSTCPQDPMWHAEGDVGIHTRMVVEALCALAPWRELPVDARHAVFAACLLHDVAKPDTTRRDGEGRITARGHSLRGSIRAREILWRLGMAPAARELVCHLVHNHQVPFFLVDRDDAEAVAIRISWTARADLLALVAEADARGRICHDQQRLLDQIELFREFCGERGILAKAQPFGTAEQRLAYFRDPHGRHPDAPAAPAGPSHVIVLSGLPAAGKDTWLRRHPADLPVVSLDALRAELGVDPDDNQGPVAHRARELAREHLRAGRDFAWNATNLGSDVRRPLLDLLFGYRAHVRLVHLETSAAEQDRRNRARAQPVPQRALQRMLSRWQTPDPTEAHAVELVVT